MTDICTLLTVADWMEQTGAAAPPAGADGAPMDADQDITLSPNGEEYCVGPYDGHQTWMRFDGGSVIGDETGGWTDD